MVSLRFWRESGINSGSASGNFPLSLGFSALQPGRQLSILAGPAPALAAHPISNSGLCGWLLSGQCLAVVLVVSVV